MAHANLAAMRGQTELELGAFRPGLRPLCFLSTPSRMHFIAIFGGHVYEARKIIGDGVVHWCTSIRRRQDRINFIAREAFIELGDAIDFLQALAAQAGAAE